MELADLVRKSQLSMAQGKISIFWAQNVNSRVQNFHFLSAEFWFLWKLHFLSAEFPFSESGFWGVWFMHMADCFGLGACGKYALIISSVTGTLFSGLSLMMLLGITNIFFRSMMIYKVCPKRSNSLNQLRKWLWRFSMTESSINIYASCKEWRHSCIWYSSGSISSDIWYSSGSISSDIWQRLYFTHCSLERTSCYYHLGMAVTCVMPMDWNVAKPILWFCVLYIAWDWNSQLFSACNYTYTEL